jgi:predicted N-acetyltransferase YhbS
LAHITYRPFVAADLPRIRDIDRSERIGVLYIQHGTRLEERRGDFDSPNWLSEGDGEHSYAEQQAYVEKLLASGAVALGAFDGDRLTGIGVLVQHLRPGVAQLAHLHVSNGYRASGIGKRLSEDVDRIARSHSIWIWLRGGDGIHKMGIPSPIDQKAMLTPSRVLAYWMRGSIARIVQPAWWINRVAICEHVRCSEICIYAKSDAQCAR